jgi:hypothetical protein
MEEVDVREEEEDSKSVDFIQDRKLARSLDVMRIRLSSDWACCAKVIAKVTSSAGVSEVIRRGCDNGDKGEDIDTRYGRRKDVGAVIEPFVFELQVVAWNDRFDSFEPM